MIENDWKVTRLSDLVDDAIGGLWGNPHDSAKSDEADVLIVRGADFRNWETRRALDAPPRRVPFRSLERRRLLPGDLVLEVSGGSPAQPVGRTLVIDKQAVTQSEMPLICSNFCRKIRLKSGVNPYFVKRQLDWLYHSGHTDHFQTSTTNIRNLQVEDFLNGTSIALPDEEMQARLTQVLDQLDGKRISSSKHVAGAGRAIERFRQSVLAAACSGRLTADWREDQSTTTGLVRELRSLKASRRRPVALPDVSLVGDVPSGWDVVVLDLLVDRIDAGKSFNAQPRPAKEGEWGVVKVSAMSWGRFLENENKAIPADKEINPMFEIRPGDLLISRANTAELAGATVLVDRTRPQLLLSDKSLRLVTHPPIDKAWLNYTLGAPAIRRQFADRATGTSDSMRNLSQEKILATTLALPPVEEQVEIARLVRQLFALASRLAARIDNASRRIESTSQAVLARAFRGELLSLGPE